jgi:hypothetical protein
MFVTRMTMVIIGLLNLSGCANQCLKYEGTERESCFEAQRHVRANTMQQQPQFIYQSIDVNHR